MMMWDEEREEEETERRRGGKERLLCVDDPFLFLSDDPSLSVSLSFSPGKKRPIRFHHSKSRAIKPIRREDELINL